jgi:hypothetical protein
MDVPVGRVVAGANMLYFYVWGFHGDIRSSKPKSIFPLKDIQNIKQ